MKPSLRALWLVLLPLLLLLNTVPAPKARAQEVVMDAARLAHALDRLSSTARVLFIAAHPDDENTRLLAYLANARHVTAAYLSMTRGGGGQNLIGREQDSLLDALRTQELLAARRIDGAEQRFTRMRDFGYSKSATETLALWGHDEALADVVFAIRSFQPDVIITRFNEQPPNHGHHTASALLAREALAAAADASRFPEHLKLGLRTHQAKRLIYNLPHWRKDPPPSDALALDLGGYDTRFGLSYGELAARSRSEHKSQGFGASGERGELLERFVHVAGERATRDPLDGVEPTWARYGAAGRPLMEALAEARKRLHRDVPERALAGLVRAHAALDALPGHDPRVQDARTRTAELIVAASGLFARATAPRARCAPGQLLPVKLELLLRRPAELRLLSAVLPDGGRFEAPGAPLAMGQKHELTRELRCPAEARISTPFWLAKRPLPGRHVVDDLALLRAAEEPAPLTVALELRVHGRPLALTVPVLHAFTDRVHGERETRVLVVPPATLTPARDALMFPNGRRARLSLRVRSGMDALEGRVLLELPEGYRAEPAEHALKLALAGDETVLTFEITPPRGAQASPKEELRARPVVEVAGKRWSFREDALDYAHVPPQAVLQEASVRLVPLKLTVPKGLVGYVEGSGDTIAADLAHVGVAVETLDDAALLEGDLGRYSAIVLGVRAHNTRDALKAAHGRLVRYVEQGGTLVVQYVTRSSFSALDQPIGPYPLEVGRGRVTDETAAVSFVTPRHALVQRPNRLTPSDFEGWVQERGLYFAERWDDRYQPLLELADPGEQPQRGALLVARVGRGRYVYTGLALFRQLPAGVPGAYRLLANLIAREGGQAP